MTQKEIAELAAWTAKSIKDTLTMDKRQLDDAGEDIIREYVKTALTNWQRGEIVTLEKVTQLAQEIMVRRRSDTATESEVFNALAVLCAKFPKLIEEESSKRAIEAYRIAAAMPAVKV